jgi:hypothetical protein
MCLAGLDSGERLQERDAALAHPVFLCIRDKGVVLSEVCLLYEESLCEYDSWCPFAAVLIRSTQERGIRREVLGERYQGRDIRGERDLP